MMDLRKDVLRLENVTKTFGGLTAVSDVSFAVREGEIFGIIGPNGAGKTTLFNLITAVYRPTSGKIIFQKKVLARAAKHDNLFLQPYQVAQAGVGRTFQNIRLFKKLSVYENVLTACHQSADYRLAVSFLPRTIPFTGVIFPWAGKLVRQEQILGEQADTLLNMMGLSEYRDMTAANLPYGLQRKLEIARSLALNPKLLLLDEPAAGMNPEETLALLELIRKIRDEFKLTVLIIEHHMDLVMNLCDKIYVLNFGKFLAEGTPEEIQNNREVVEAYLGKEEPACCM